MPSRVLSIPQGSVTRLSSRGTLQMLRLRSSHMRTHPANTPTAKKRGDTKTPGKAPALFWGEFEPFPPLKPLGRPLPNGRITDSMFRARVRWSGRHCAGDVYFSPYWCLSIDTFFFKLRTPTDSAEMSHRSRKETAREAALVSEGHWQGNLTVPAPPPPMPRH